MKGRAGGQGVGKFRQVCLAVHVITAVSLSGAVDANDRPIVIAHRGACGYLPEHTLEAAALAYGMGADYIEQDVVLTKDDVPVVSHDIHLDTVTNVASVFPDRSRKDGRYYAIDFTLKEIKSLRANERVDHKTAKPVFPKRFPVGRSRFEVATFAEHIELIQGLNKSTGRGVGIYPEVKSPAWHRKSGKDISRIVLDVLKQYGYEDGNDAVFVQCFDAVETRRMREQLKTRLKLVQLLGDKRWDETSTDYDRLRAEKELRSIAEYANGIGPSLSHVANEKTGKATALIRMAHEHRLVVHPYTIRSDSLPKYAKSHDSLLDVVVKQAKADGFFTDFSDKGVTYLHGVSSRRTPGLK